MPALSSSHHLLRRVHGASAAWTLGSCSVAVGSGDVRVELLWCIVLRPAFGTCIHTERPSPCSVPVSFGTEVFAVAGFAVHLCNGRVVTWILSLADVGRIQGFVAVLAGEASRVPTFTCES